VLGLAAGVTPARRALASDARKLRAEGTDPIGHTRTQRAADRAEAAKANTFKDIANAVCSLQATGDECYGLSPRWRG
jgi:hypothetical protein